MNEQFDFTELGERLRGPNGGEVAEEALQRLGRLAAETETRLAGGLPPEEYEANRRLSAALAAAQRVVVGFRQSLTLKPGDGNSSPTRNGERNGNGS
jgi:hypothetical protein